MAKIKIPGIGDKRGEIIFDQKILTIAAEAAFRRAVEELGYKYDELISKVGAFPGFPRSDIIDTGFLLENQGFKFVKPGEAVYEFGAKYALYVHEGYTLRNGKRQPGRPWTELGIEEYGLRDKFEEYLREELKKRGIIGRLPKLF